jgi:hypothetical protein
MSFTLVIVFGFSILIAGVIGLIRFGKIRKEFYPFVFLMWVAGINEIISYVLYKNGMYNIINSNIYGLVESLLLLWFFYNLNVLKKKSSVFISLSVIFFVAWIVENIFLHKFGTAFNSYFNIIYGLPIVLLSVTAINDIILAERSIIKHPAFLICISIIVFFTYRIVIEVFWLYGLDASRSFRSNVYNILVWINLFCNLIYALAILWIRKRQEFTLQY